MFEDTYKTIKERAEGLYKEKGSRFIAIAFPVETEEEIKDIIVSVKKKYHDARHHCYAYILGPYKDAYRLNDDGEPSGTGGRPIHGQLLSQDLTNTLVVVIRYFGGVKLGVSGLMNAYKIAAKDALDHATIIEKTIDDTFCIHFDFNEMNDVMKILKDNSIKIIEQSFDNNCIIRFSVRKRESERFSSALQKIKNLQIELA